MLKRELEALLSAQKQNNPLADLKFLKPVQVPKVYPISRARLYQVLADGSIKSILLRQKHSIRGSRLISVASIEAYLARLAKEQQDAGFTRAIPKEYNTGRRGKRSGGTERNALSQSQEAEPVPQVASSELKRRGRGRPRKVETAA
jgi:hypothetical protein